MNRSEQVLYIQDKNGLHRVLSSDNSEGIHRLNIIGRFLPMGKPLFLAVPLSLTQYSKQGRRRAHPVSLSVNIRQFLFFYC